MESTSRDEIQLAKLDPFRARVSRGRFYTSRPRIRGRERIFTEKTRFKNSANKRDENKHRATMPRFGEALFHRADARKQRRIHNSREKC